MSGLSDHDVKPGSRPVWPYSFQEMDKAIKWLMAEPAPVKVFDYLVLELDEPSEIAETLKKVGAEGWELVAGLGNLGILKRESSSTPQNVTDASE